MAIIIDPIYVEPMRRADVETVSAIEKRCYATPWHANAYYTELSNRAAAYLVARMDGKVIGYGGMWVIMDEAHITTLAVDPPHQGKKIGERLLQGLMEEAILHGASRATLEVREHNVAAQGLYRKYGFREAGLRHRYYSDNQEDALIMWTDEINSTSYKQRFQETKALLMRKLEAQS